MTAVAKVFVNTLQGAGIAEKTDDNQCGFVLQMDNTGALGAYVLGYVATYVNTSAGAVAPAQWVQVAFTWDGTGGNTSPASAHIYVNGVEQAKVTSHTGSYLCNGTSITNNSFRIGNASTGLTGMIGSLNGKIAY